MIKLRKKQIIICIVLLFIIIICIPMVSYCLYLSSLTTYTLTPEICQQLFKCTPEEFSEEQHYVSSWTFDYAFCEKYYVDKNNNLVLKMNDSQIERMQTHYCNDTRSWVNYLGINITNDYSSVTVYTNGNLAFYYINIGIGAVEGCIVNQLIDGTEANDISVDFTVIDSGNGKIMFSAVSPQEPLDWYNYCSSSDFTSDEDTTETSE